MSHTVKNMKIIYNKEVVRSAWYNRRYGQFFLYSTIYFALNVMCFSGGETDRYRDVFLI